MSEERKDDIKKVEAELENIEMLSDEELEKIAAGATSPYVKKKVAKEIIRRG